jgi:O-antigen ligase
MILKILLKSQLYLIISLPFLLISGPALSDIAISLSGILFIIYFLISNNKNVLDLRILFLFLIFYFLLIISSILSDNIKLSFESSLFYFRFLFFIFSIKLVFTSDKKYFKYFFYSFLITFIILICDSFYQYFIGYNILGFEYDGMRLSSFFNDEKKMGSYLARLTPIFLVISILIYGNSKRKIIYILSLILIIDVIVILTGERSSIFYVLLSTALITFTIKRWKIYRLLAFAISLIVSSIIIYSNETIKERVILKTLDQTNILNQKVNTFSIQHQVIYSTAFKIFNDNQLIGIGPKLFREKCKIQKYKTYTSEDQSVDGCQTHPHNTYIQLLVETGIFGFLFIFILFLYLNYILIKHFFYMIFKKLFLISDSNLCFFAAIYINLWPLVPTGSFFNNWLSIIYFLPIGLLLSNFNVLKKK